MNLSRLTELRTRLATRTVVDAARPWALAAAATCLAMVVLDATVGLSASWRLAGLSVVAALAIAGAKQYAEIVSCFVCQMCPQCGDVFPGFCFIEG